MELKRRVFRTRLSAEDPLVRDHRVHGVRILPGVTFLDLILRMARTCGLDPTQVVLRRILFTKPIALEAGHERWVRLVLEPRSDGAQVHILSARRGDSEEATADWEENARADLVVEPSPAPPGAAVQAAPEPNSDWQDLDAAYERARATGIRHQDFMKSQGRFRLTPQGVWAEITLAESAQARASDFWLHPALLDAATVVAALPLADSATAAGGDAFIPFVIDQFRAVASLPSRCLLHAGVPVAAGADTDMYSQDLDLFEPTGRCLARFTRLTAKRIRSAESIHRLAGGPASAPALAASPTGTVATPPVTPVPPPVAVPPTLPAASGSGWTAVRMGIAAARSRNSRASARVKLATLRRERSHHRRS